MRVTCPVPTPRASPPALLCGFPARFPHPASPRAPELCSSFSRRRRAPSEGSALEPSGSQRVSVLSPSHLPSPSCFLNPRTLPQPGNFLSLPRAFYRPQYALTLWTLSTPLEMSPAPAPCLRPGHFPSRCTLSQPDRVLLTQRGDCILTHEGRDPLHLQQQKSPNQ